MKAAVYEKYGSPEVVVIKDIQKPTPENKEILIKNHATTLHRGDTRMRKFDVPRAMWLPSRLFLGILKPKRKILGMELAGVIEEVGKDVSQFKVGDQVFASTGMQFGGHAEYTCLSEEGLICIKPDNVSFGEAAALTNGASTALLILRDMKIQEGQTMLIYGASGSVGTFAVQLAAKYFKADVTGVCSTKNMDLVKSLGANNVKDYTKADFILDDEKYDIIFDAVGEFGNYKNLLKDGGNYFNVHKDPKGKMNVEDLNFLIQLCAKNEIKSVIDKSYPFEEIVEAHRYVDKGRKVGNVVINFS